MVPRVGPPRGIHPFVSLQPREAQPVPVPLRELLQVSKLCPPFALAERMDVVQFQFAQHRSCPLRDSFWEPPTARRSSRDTHDPRGSPPRASSSPSAGPTATNKTWTPVALIQLAVLHFLFFPSSRWRQPNRSHSSWARHLGFAQSRHFSGSYHSRTLEIVYETGSSPTTCTSPSTTNRRRKGFSRLPSISRLMRSLS